VTGLAQSAGRVLRLTLAAGFLASAAFLFYAASKGIHLRLGRHVMMGPTQALWPAVLCLAFGIGLLPHIRNLAGARPGQATRSRAKAKPSRKASAPKKATSRRNARGSDPSAVPM
jgi:hypothetical protein